MSIGDQEFNGEKITEAELRKKYDDLIKEAEKEDNNPKTSEGSKEVSKPVA